MHHQVKNVALNSVELTGMKGTEIIVTADGSHSLLNTALNETYHSVHGALQESKHVFLQQGLEFFLHQADVSEVKIFEVGFGTGLNAFITQQYADTRNITVHYTSLEAFPLPDEIWKQLNYADENRRAVFHQLHQVAWQSTQIISPHFHLLKLHETLAQVVLAAKMYDVIYFDAFAPSKQPEMWALPMLQKMVEAIRPGGVFVTYCAKGQLKRDLASFGLIVETLPGPPGKKEMVRARKANQ